MEVVYDHAFYSKIGYALLMRTFNYAVVLLLLHAQKFTSPLVVVVVVVMIVVAGGGAFCEFLQSISGQPKLSACS